jgi:hypothetical protein
LLAASKLPAPSVVVYASVTAFSMSRGTTAASPPPRDGAAAADDDVADKKTTQEVIIRIAKPTRQDQAE